MNIPTLSQYDSFKEFWKAAELFGEGFIPSGLYPSEEWIFNTKDHSTPFPVRISGYGAKLEKGLIEFNRSRLVVEGLSAVNSEVGFRFLRGQGSRFTDLTAKDCGQGFSWTKGEYKNTQFTYSLVQNCFALNNDIGYYFDSEAIVNRSWCNANTFIALTARQNRIGLEADSTYVNYNTFVGCAFELNSEPIDIDGSRANTFIGGHFADQNPGNVSANMGPFTHCIGGRYVGKVLGNPQILANSGVTGEGGLVARLKLDEQQ